MSERRHTEGPWGFGRTGEEQRLILGEDGKGRYVCTVRIHQTPREFGVFEEPEREANAHLIAAAPDMFEALEQAYAFIADEYGDAEAQALDGEHVSREARPVWNSICNALAKARAEPKETS